MLSRDQSSSVRLRGLYLETKHRRERVRIFPAGYLCPPPAVLRQPTLPVCPQRDPYPTWPMVPSNRMMFLGIGCLKERPRGGSLERLGAGMCFFVVF